MNAIKDEYEERAAILEFDAHRPRAMAERLALEMTARAHGLSEDDLRGLLKI